MSLTKIGSIGINTGIAFAGVTTIVTLNTANDALSIGATVNVGSGITLGASGDIFATGVSTFSGNLKVGSGVTISPDGDGFYTGIVTATTFSGSLAASNLTGALPAISGANLTNLDASDLASGTVPTARLGSGTASSSTFLRGDSSFQTVNTDLVSDTSPQLGGDLDTNSHNILLDDSHAVKFGNSTELEIQHTGSSGYAHFGNTTGNLIIDTSGNFYVRNATGSETMIQANANGAVDLYHDNVKTAYTKSTGFEIKGGNTSDQTELQVIGNEGQDASILLGSDDGDDNADYWRMYAQASDNAFTLKNYAAGSYETSIKANGNGNVELYYDNSKKLETTSSGVTITNDLLLDGSANLGNYIRTNYDGGAHMYFRNNSQGANYSSHFQTYLSSDEAGTAQTHIHYYHGGYCELLHQGDSVIRTLADGVQFRDGGAVKGQFTDEGLCFGTDTATANALDDYEEGTFTPKLGGTSNSSTYNVDGTGTYTKIGAVVTVQIRFNGVDLNNNASGDAKIFNMPFTASRNATNGSSGTTTDVQYYNVPFGTDNLPGWYIINGSTAWVGIISRNNTSWIDFPVSDFHAGGLYVMFSGTYFTAT